MKPKFLGPKLPHNPNSIQSKQIASSSSISINSTRYQDSPYFNTNGSSSYTNTHSFNPSSQSNASTSCSPSSTSSTSSSSSSSNQRSSNLSNEGYFKEGSYDYDYQVHLNYLNYTNQQFHHQQQQNRLASKSKLGDGMDMVANDSMKESLNKLNTNSTNPNRFSSNNANNKVNPSKFMLNPNASNNSNTNQKLIEAIYTSTISNTNAGSNNKNDNLNPKTNLCNLKIFLLI